MLKHLQVIIAAVALAMSSLVATAADHPAQALVEE